MKLVIEKIKNSPDCSFSMEHNVLPYFISSWHFHHESEIILIEKGSGTLFAGDYNQPYKQGAIAIIGANLPHVWLSDKEYYKPKTKLISESIVLKFADDFLGNEFMVRPEMSKLNVLIKNSNRGLLFHGKTRDSLETKIRGMMKARGFERIMTLLSILDEMSSSKDFIYLSSKGYTHTFNDSDCDRIDKVYKFVMNNYTRDISLDEISNIATMSPTAFCRYFKARTLKTFSQFVNEVRIGHACNLLIEKKYSISEVSYRSGYNYLSNFFKQFKLVMKMTPQDYQKKYWDTLFSETAQS